MSIALGVVLLLVAGLSVAATLRLVPGPDADQVRGFCVVGATGSVVVALAVLGIGLAWDSRIADTVAIIALFALVVYYLVALLINVWPRPNPESDCSIPQEVRHAEETSRRDDRAVTFRAGRSG